VNEVSGRDMTWFFDQVYRSSNTFDYAIDSIRTAPVSVSGFVDGGARQEFVARKAEPGRHRTVVVARRLGEAVFPVEVQVRFANGEKVRERWDGAERWRMFTYERSSPAVSAEVDPDRVLALDTNFTNNGKAVSPASHDAAHKWSLTWMAWLEDLLLTYAFFV